VTGDPGPPASPSPDPRPDRDGLRRLRREVRAVDPRSELRSYLGSVARHLVEATGSRACGISARFPEADRDIFLLLAPGRPPLRRSRALGPRQRSRDLPVPERSRPEAGWFSDDLGALAAEADVAAARVISAAVRPRGRPAALVELADPDPAVIPDAGVLGGFLTEVASSFELAFLYERLRRERLESRLLQEVAQELGRTLNLRDLLTLILDLLRQVVPYDAAVIYLLGEDGLDVVHQSLRGYPEGGEEFVQLKVGQGIVGSVARSGRPEIVADVAEDPRYYNARPATRSEMVAPLLSGGRVFGAFNLESDRPRAYTAHDLELLENFAGQAAVALERARLLEQEAERRRLEQELRIARRIQRYFLPKLPEHLRRRGLDGRTLPCEEVSGDYYDFLERRDGSVAVAVSDVSGKGIPAALIMSSLRTAFRLGATQRSHPSVLARELNTFLKGSLRETEFVTGVFGVLDPGLTRFRYTNAGHNPPLLLRAGGEVEWLDVGGMILGAFPNQDYEETEVDLGPGDLLVLYTDGLTEALSPEGEEFGEERLVAAVRAGAEAPPRALISEVIGAVRVFAAGKLPDDLTVVAVTGGAEEASR
jgi:sigma-B regulation protein RsbU (phosphoserine phosphatase)